MSTIGSTILAIRRMHPVLAFLCMALTVAAHIPKVVRETIIIGFAICLPSR